MCMYMEREVRARSRTVSEFGTLVHIYIYIYTYILCSYTK